MLKKLKDLKLSLDKSIYKKEYIAAKSISKLEGFLLNSEFSDLYDKLIILKEIINNNEIENIHTTYLNMLSLMSKNKTNNFDDLTSFYNIKAIKEGIEYIRKNNFIDKKILITIQQIIRNTNDGIRKNIGTKILNSNNEIIYIPPQEFNQIMDYLNELELFINDSFECNKMNEYGPLIKMAIIHYQFESIHPFNDANGRTGRILNLLYLIYKQEIEKPLFALNYYIAKNKQKYYKCLSSPKNNDDNLNEIINYFLDGINESCKDSINCINDLKNIYEKILNTKFNIKINNDQIKILFNNLFFDLNSFKSTLDLSDNTARKYINELLQNNVLSIINNRTKNKKYVFSDLLEYIGQLN